MFRNFKLIVAALAVVGLAAGCASKPMETKSFLTDYDNLKLVDEDFSFYKAPDMSTANYPKLIVTPIEFALSPDDLASFTDGQKQQIREHAQKTVNKLLTPYFQMVQQPGPGTGKLRVAFTDIEQSNALLALYPMTRAAGAGRGGAAIQGEIVDSETNTQLVAWTRKFKGSMLHGSGAGALSDIMTAIDVWAEGAAKVLAAKAN
jgi:hypothetical protein